MAFRREKRTIVVTVLMAGILALYVYAGTMPARDAIMLFALMAFMFLFLRIKRAAVIEMVVEKRTAQLRQAKEAAIASETRQAVQFAVARVVAESGSFNEAAPKILEGIGRRLHWDAGVLWMVDAKSRVLRPSASWQKDGDPGSVEKLGEAAYLAPGVGLPGRAWQQSAAVWTDDTGPAAVAFPIRVDAQVVGVMEFLNRKPLPQDDDLLRVLDVIGNQVGQFISRREAEQEAIEAAEIKSEFASTVSHEMRTPMTVIKGGVDLIADEMIGPLNPEQKNMIASVKANADRLSRLINDVLDYQQLEARRMRFTFARHDINAVVAACVKAGVPEAEKRGLQLVSDIPAEALYVSADPLRINQVMGNLLDNAFKFMDKGTVKVSVANVDGMARVSVEDQGPGIKEGDESKLFHGFSQIGSAQERKTSGTGLGLAISKKIIEAHGGTIGFSSTFGKGSTFYFQLHLV